MDETPSPLELRLGEIEAHAKLLAAGSVMAKPQLPEWRKNASPGVQTALDVVDSVIGAVGLSPLDAAPGSAAFKGIMTKQQKQVVKALFRADPEMVDMVQKSPVEVRIATDDSFTKLSRQSARENNIGETLHQFMNDKMYAGVIIPKETIKGQVVGWPSGTSMRSMGRGTPSAVAHEVIGHALTVATNPSTNLSAKARELLSKEIQQGFIGNEHYKKYYGEESLARIIEDAVEAKGRLARGTPHSDTFDKQRVEFLEKVLKPVLKANLSNVNTFNFTSSAKASTNLTGSERHRTHVAKATDFSEIEIKRAYEGAKKYGASSLSDREMVVVAASKPEMKSEILTALRDRVAKSKWRDTVRDIVFATLGEVE